MRRALVIFSSILMAAAVTSGARARADVVTLPAAASLVGASPFFSDVRVFNTSYTDNLDVTATYRCFIGPCPSPSPVLQITLAPRESKAFDDMVASADGFNAANTGGGVEFEFSGSEDQLVVTSRLFSTAPQNSVGMFIPGLDESDAHATTVLTSIRHDPNTVPPSGFRTNVGVFNPEDGATNVTFTIFDGGTNQLGNPVVRTVPGHSGVQVSQFFEAAGAGGVSTENAVIVVAADSEVFSYASVLDNRTADPIFVIGAQDQPPQAITPVPTTPQATPTPTPPGPTPTPTPTTGAASIRTVNVGANGETQYQDTVSGGNTSTITVGTTVHWVWVDALHSSTSDDGIWDSGEHTESEHFTFDHTFTSPGTFGYHCTYHGKAMMSGTVIVNP